MGTARIPFLALALVILAALARRDRETDVEGNPSLRFWSGCVLCWAAGAFFLYEAIANLHDLFHQRYPENTVVEASLSLLSFLGGLWCYFIRITLMSKMIEVRYPLMSHPTYAIADVDRIDHLGRNNDVVQMKNGRRILIIPLLSGRPHFLEALRSAVIDEQAVSQ
jgi:hypothetical protein